jgi:hypothetical protein
MITKSPMDRVFAIAGGPSKIAKRISEIYPDTRITPWAVSKWRKRVPSDRVLFLEQLTVDEHTGEPLVTRYELRPDVFGPSPQSTEREVA